MVVPVPCKLEKLLKLLTRTCPSVKFPIVCFTNATPYGFTSWLLGSVDAMVDILCKFFKILSLSCARRDGPITKAPIPTHRTPASARVILRIFNLLSFPRPQSCPGRGDRDTILGLSYDG